ncbi:MAG: asparagine synthetase B [Candidatus Bathyarchaeia archaeon]|jgi:asparagine synthase (glutamine-hydrolysing)
MGALVAVLDKTGENAIRTALTMIEAMNSNKPEAYGVASPQTVGIEKSLSTLQKTRVESSTAVGYAFSQILSKDKPQPLKCDDGAIVFDGRLYPVETSSPDAEIVASQLISNLEQATAVFAQKANGDFALAVARTEKIVAARDSMGVRPLYYGENEEFAALASERKALWSIGIKDTNSFPPGCVSLVDGNGFKFTVARRITFSKPKQITMQRAAHELHRLLEHSVKERVSDLKEVAIAFSGGLDSSIIASLAKKINNNVVLVHVSLRNEPEVEYAKQAAEHLKLPLYCDLQAEDKVLMTIQKVVAAIEEPDPIKVSIGIPIYWAAEKTREMGFNTMLAGQGADELFGGYKRYVDEYLKSGAKRAEKSIFNDITNMYIDNLERDSKICNHLNVELRLPFATIQMAGFALSLPLELKMERTSCTLRKLILRRVANDLLLPPEIANRPKKAIQYTTGMNKALKKIAKQQRTKIALYLQKMFEKTFQ